MKILVLNPGGNSLKAEMVDFSFEQCYAFEGKLLFSVSIEGIGKNSVLSILQGKKKLSSESIVASSYKQAANKAIESYNKHGDQNQLPKISDVDAFAVRVVHGAREFEKPTLVDADVVNKISRFEKLAPLHNKSSIEVLALLREQFPKIPIYAVFDTSFHRTIPDYASSYAIPQQLAKKHQIRRYGFHGISHRYLLERYAYLAGKEPYQCNIVSMHLESGCSVTAVEQGKSIDNTMGLTPLEGLMMGSRSGDVDPSLIALLMREEQMTVDDVMTLLNKESGLKGVSEISLDTRVLMKQYHSDPKAKLAMDIFAYRVRKAVGAYIAVLGSVDAIIFGGGIAENTKFLREVVCKGLYGFGLEIDDNANEMLIDREGRLSMPESRMQAWVIPTEEGLEMAHECSLAMREEKAL